MYHSIQNYVHSPREKYYTYMDHDGEWYTTKWIDITITDKDSYKTYKTVKRMGLRDVGRV